MAASWRPLRVMVVDDNHHQADSLASLLRAWGHEVGAAYDGEAALAALPGFVPDVMIVDLVMPGLDGNELARRIRKKPELAGVMLIAMTGHFDALACEVFDHHLLKPTPPDIIKTSLDWLRQGVNEPNNQAADGQENRSRARDAPAVPIPSCLGAACTADAAVS